MSEGRMEALDFDQYLNLSEKEARKAAVASNDAFVLAMGKAIGRGREKVTAGTTIDISPLVVRRLVGEPRHSSCGSPAAMCMEAGGAHSGAETMK